VSGPPPLPPPPATSPTTLAPLHTEPVSIWRLHWEDDPRTPDLAYQGGSRFDAPAGEYLVSYGGADRLGIFAEVFGDLGRITPPNAERRLSLLSSRRALHLVTLDDAMSLRYFGLDARICDTDDYALTRAWSTALHDWYPTCDGLRYMSRKATPHVNYCLYLDRCGDAIDLFVQGRLRDLRDLVLFAADRYRLACTIPFA
jgi:hypothetical protein